MPLFSIAVKLCFVLCQLLCRKEFFAFLQWSLNICIQDSFLPFPQPQWICIYMCLRGAKVCCLLSQELIDFVLWKSRVGIGLCDFLFAVATAPVLWACTTEGSFLWSSALPLICFVNTGEVGEEEPYVIFLSLQWSGIWYTQSNNLLKILVVSFLHSCMVPWVSLLFCFAMSETAFVFLFLTLQATWLPSDFSSMISSRKVMVLSVDFYFCSGRNDAIFSLLHIRWKWKPSSCTYKRLLLYKANASGQCGIR